MNMEIVRVRARDSGPFIRRAVRAAAEKRRSTGVPARDLAEVNVRPATVRMAVRDRMHERPRRVDQKGEKECEDQPLASIGGT